MTDYENAMTRAPKAALAERVNAFRAGRAEGARPPDQAAEAAPAPDADAEAMRARIATLSPEQRAAAASHAEILGAVSQGLAGRPYQERRAILAHMAPALGSRGVTPEALAGFDPTDANLAGVVGQAVILRGMLGPLPAAGPATPAPGGPEPAGE